MHLIFLGGNPIWVFMSHDNFLGGLGRLLHDDAGPSQTFPQSSFGLRRVLKSHGCRSNPTSEGVVGIFSTSRDFHINHILVLGLELTY